MREKSLSWLFPLILAITLIQNYFDIMAILEGGSLDLLSYEGPVYFKLLKDLSYFTIITIIFIVAHKEKRLPFSIASSLFIYFIILSFCISANLNDFTIALIGVRWAIPFLIFLLVKDVTLTLNKEASAYWLMAGMILCICVQIYELFNMPPIYGQIFGGLSARTPGFFLAPNSAAFFACTCAAVVSVFLRQNYNIRVLAALSSLIISLLAQSGTGIVTASVLVVWIALRRYALIALITSIFLAPIVFLNLNEITMRDDYVSRSGGNRVDVFNDLLSSAMSSIGNFGIYTNAGMLQGNSYAANFAVDSLWASWFGNFGILSLVQFSLVAFFIFKIRAQIDWKQAFPCITVFFLFSMTTIIFEAYPMNILLGFGFWASLKYFPINENTNGLV